jgi:hypothetical protein
MKPVADALRQHHAAPIHADSRGQWLMIQVRSNRPADRQHCCPHGPDQLPGQPALLVGVQAAGLRVLASASPSGPTISIGASLPSSFMYAIRPSIAKAASESSK